MEGSLIDIIDCLDEVDDSDRFAVPEIFAHGGPDALPSAKARVCVGDEAGSFVCPEDSELSYALEVPQAKEAMDVLSEWRGGRQPTREEKFAAVMFYSRNDAWLPLE